MPAYILFNLQSIIRNFILLTHMQKFYLLLLLTYKIQPHVTHKRTWFQFSLWRRIYTQIQAKRIKYSRLAFIFKYRQSFIHNFHTDIQICIKTCLQTDMDCTSTSTQLLMFTHFPFKQTYNLNNKFVHIYKQAGLRLRDKHSYKNHHLHSSKQSNGHAVKSSYLLKNQQMYLI